MAVHTSPDKCIVGCIIFISMLCDGMKSSCAAKNATAVSCGLMSVAMSLQSRCFQPRKGLTAHKNWIILEIKRLTRVLIFIMYFFFPRYLIKA